MLWILQIANFSAQISGACLHHYLICLISLVNLVQKLHRQHVPKQDVILVYSSLCTVFPTTVHTVHEAIGVEGWGKESVC